MASTTRRSGGKLQPLLRRLGRRAIGVLSVQDVALYLRNRVAVLRTRCGNNAFTMRSLGLRRREGADCERWGGRPIHQQFQAYLMRGQMYEITRAALRGVFCTQYLCIASSHAKDRQRSHIA